MVGRGVPAHVSLAVPLLQSSSVIRLGLLIYVCLPLSLRNVEDLLFELSIDIWHETLWLWWSRFGLLFAGDIRRQRVSRIRDLCHWRWHLDDMYVEQVRWYKMGSAKEEFF